MGGRAETPAPVQDLNREALCLPRALRWPFAKARDRQSHLGLGPVLETLGGL